jgi:hypothetical protein
MRVTMIATVLFSVLISGAAMAQELEEACLEASKGQVQAFMSCAAKRTLELAKTDLEPRDVANQVHATCAEGAAAIKQAMRAPGCDRSDDQANEIMQQFLDANRDQIINTVKAERN